MSDFSRRPPPVYPARPSSNVKRPPAFGRRPEERISRRRTSLRFQHQSATPPQGRPFPNLEEFSSAGPVHTSPAASSRTPVLSFPITSTDVEDPALPLYEYKCAKCGNKYEKIESYSAKETQKCPKCGGKAERQVSAAGIQFKGSGWYVTDYKGKNSDNTSVAKPDETSASNSSDSSDSKSKDAGTSESKSSTDSKSNDAKSSDSKSSESKSSASKSSSEKGSSKKKK
jgi:putative FmdB family regulatory protein